MKYIFFLFIILSFVSPVQAEEKILRIYQDADLSNHSESSEAIQKGIEVAFDEIGNKVGGHKVKFKYLNHRGNVVRSKLNYNKFLNDSQALAIYSGIHSPPLITNRAFINENKALTLVPWAAGSPITRYPSAENWVFRLSVDDKYAGPVIVDFAVKEKKCAAPHLLLEDSPWGNSNLSSMTNALREHNITKPSVTRFGWNIRDQGARVIIRSIMKGNNDCIILVSNTIEGAVIAQAVIDTKANLPIISHWGITGGDFHEKIPAKSRKNIDLSFIQSCFAFTNKEQSDFSKNVFERLQNLSGDEMKNMTDLKSAVGFIHAYDLTKLLIAAIQQAELTGNIKKDREAVRIALEELKNPIQGLIKTYQKPYSIFDAATNADAHEALHKEDYCMAQYGEKDEILIITNNNK
jgi:branched-chain amino acid transport system substrate-binding protein